MEWWKRTLVRAFGTGVVLLLAISIQGCATKPGEVFNTQLTEHRRLATPADLADELQRADFVILGEQHDNAEHHNLQLNVLKELNRRGWLKQVSLEMLVPSQQSAADFALKEQITDQNKLYQILSWKKGWEWELYGPIVSWTISSGIALKAGNLDEGELKTVRDQPVRLGEKLLGESGLDIHRNQFRESHCGHTNKAREEVMLRVQVARDARMAASLASVKTGSVLLAGNWHARKDIGVPRYVRVSQPMAKLLTVGAMEEPTDDSQTLAKKYDIVWTTSGVERPDFCAMFKNGNLKLKQP